MPRLRLALFLTIAAVLLFVTGLFFGMTAPLSPAPSQLHFWIPIAITASIAVYLLLSALLEALPEERRGAMQAAVAALVAVALAAVFAAPARALPSPFALTRDQWPLAVALAVFSIPLAFFLVRAAIPARAFIATALAGFVLILPDFIGVYVLFTGEWLFRHGMPVQETQWVFDEAESIARYRATGIFVTWYLAVLAGAWAPLVYALHRRRLRARPPAPVRFGRPTDRNP